MQYFDKFCKSMIILFSAVFLFSVLSIFVSDRLYSMSLALEAGKMSSTKALNLMDIAVKMDPANAGLHFRQYEILSIRDKNEKRGRSNKTLTRQLHILGRCIDLCPSLAKYHVCYAFILKELAPNSNILTKEAILSELKKATELKPYSELYLEIYEKYKKSFNLGGNTGSI